MPLEMVNQLPYNHPYRWDGTLFGKPKLWRPNVLGASLGLWLDAEDDQSIILNGATVSQWNDRSGNGRNATQATAANQPTYTTAGLNNKPILTFNGTTNVMSVDLSFVADASYSVLAVTARTSNRANNFFIGGNSQLTNRQLIAGWISDLSFVYAQFGNDVSVTVPGYTVTTPLIFALGLNTSVGRNVYLDGTLGNSNTNTTALISNTGGVLGAWSNNTFYQGYIAELAITTGVLSVDNRQKLEGYLAWKWGLQGNLPEGHPYKSFPPTI